MTRPTPPTILVTGATNVLGYETARVLANTVGANVIVHGPTEIGARNVRTRLIRHGASPGQMEAVSADFTRFSEVAPWHGSSRRDIASIDVLINNGDGRPLAGDV